MTSRDDAYAMSPERETRPYVGFIPTTPQKDAGCLTLPPVSLPKEMTHCLAATAAADPPDEPPGTRDVSQGLRVAYQKTKELNRNMRGFSWHRVGDHSIK